MTDSNPHPEILAVQATVVREMTLDNPLDTYQEKPTTEAELVSRPIESTAAIPLEAAPPPPPMPQ